MPKETDATKAAPAAEVTIETVADPAANATETPETAAEGAAPASVSAAPEGDVEKPPVSEEGGADADQKPAEVAPGADAPPAAEPAAQDPQPEAEAAEEPQPEPEPEPLADPEPATLSEPDNVDGNPASVSAAPPRPHEQLVSQLEIRWRELVEFVRPLEGDLDGELGIVLRFVRGYIEHHG